MNVKMPKEVKDLIRVEVIDLVKVLGIEVLEELKKYFGKTHGSKVKEGRYKDCTIELNGDKAFIVVNPEKGEVVWLTSDNIQSYQFIKEKERLHKGKKKMYYYYHITFKDGSTSCVRMREKYKTAMIRHTPAQV